MTYSIEVAPYSLGSPKWVAYWHHSPACRGVGDTPATAVAALLELWSELAPSRYSA